jgi:ligand-binding sensor domain-containing protein
MPMASGGIATVVPFAAASLASTSSLAVEEDGSAWVLTSGALIRVDPAGHTDRWSAVDDPLFGSATAVSPSASGGVWVLGRDQLRRFDGDGFSATIPLPTGDEASGFATDAAEGPDGQVWVTAEKGVYRWSGTSLKTLPWAGTGMPGEIGFDIRGRTWVSMYEYPGPTGRGAAVLEGTSWTRYSESDMAVRGPLRAITSAPDGTMWFGGDAGLGRYDGTRWAGAQTVGSSLGAGISSLSVAADGTLWAVASGSGGGPTIARRTGSQWQPVEAPDVADSGGWTVIDARTDHVLLAGDGGIQRLDGDEWVPVWPTEPFVGPTSAISLAAVSADEVLVGAPGRWEPGTGAVWRSASGIWQRDASEGAPTDPVRSVAVGPDGSLWVSADGGLFVRRSGRWSRVTDGAMFGKVAFTSDGTAWVAGWDRGLLRVTGGPPEWTVQEVAGSPVQSIQDVVVTKDGTVWVASWGSWTSTGGLARYDGRAWTEEDPLDGPTPQGTGRPVQALLAASDGSLWVSGRQAATSPSEGPLGAFDPEEFQYIARYTDGAWAVVLRSDEMLPLAMDLAEAADGAIVAVGDGWSTYQDGTWTQQLTGIWLDAVSVAPDGAIWALGNSLYRLR